MAQKQLRRTKDCFIAGVVGGFANYLNIDPTILRIVFAALTFFTAFSGVLVYVIAWILMPEE